MKNFILNIINNVHDETELYDNEEIQNGKDMGILCYIVPFIPYFFYKKNSFVKYHSIIGMNLYLIIILDYICFKMFSKSNYSFIQILLSIIGLILLILCCVGISNVCSGKVRELPIINVIKVFK